MSLFSPLLIVCLDPEEAAALSQLARALGYPDAHIIAGGFDEATLALDQRTTAPEYIIIDIGDHGADVLPALDAFAVHCEESVRVIVIGGINDIVFYRELKSRGVLEYFPRPAQAADIRALLMNSRPAPAPATAADQPSQATVISVMSAASGDGASTLAMNLAYALAETYKQPTVLVDMDYQFGLVAKSLDLAAPFGIRELFDYPDRGLDSMLIGKMLASYTEHLSIIAAPGELRLLPAIRPEIVRELVALLRSRFAFVVIDIPHVWTDWTAAALTYSDQAVMVGQLWLRSLTHATRLLTSWHSIGLARDSVSLVINRSGAKFKEAITPQDFERICHHVIDAHIDNDVKAVTQAETEGRTLFEIKQGAELRQQIKGLAVALAGRQPGDSAEAKPARPARKGLLTRRSGK